MRIAHCDICFYSTHFCIDMTSIRMISMTSPFMQRELNFYLDSEIKIDFRMSPECKTTSERKSRVKFVEKLNLR